MSHKETTQSTEELASENYSETTKEISKLYETAPRHPRWYNAKELPGKVIVGQEDGYHSPGTLSNTTRISNDKGTSVKTLYSVNPLELHKNVVAETSHTIESGEEVKYTGATSRHKIMGEVTRGEYKHEFISPQAASLVTKLALKRVKQTIEEGRQQENEQRKVA
jgi:hypothetical protein